MSWLARALHSPVLMTWSSIGTRLLGLILLLPLALQRFSHADFALWLLLGTIAGLQMLADMGFSQTFIRAVACTEGGASVDMLRDLRVAPAPRSGVPDPAAMRQLLGTMKHVYTRLLLLSAILLPLLILALLRPVQVTDHPAQAWIAALLVLGGAFLTLRGNLYSAYLQGRNRIALLRRWETLFATGSLASAVTTLVLLDGDLLDLVATQQAWTVLGFLRNRWLCRQDTEFREGMRCPVDRQILDALWPTAWRSGIGVLTSLGLVQLSGVAYAQVGESVGVASYLLALRLIQTISQFSQAPFYSKIPSLSRLRSQGRIEDIARIALRSMGQSYWTYMAGFLLTGLLAPPLLELIGSSTPFVSPLIWTLLGAAFLAERAGAMHLQLYSTTNHIIWHIANGWSGIVMIITAACLFPLCGVLAFPLAMLLAYLLVYCPISMRHSYRSLGLPALAFEVDTGLAPILGLGVVWALSNLLPGT